MSDAGQKPVEVSVTDEQSAIPIDVEPVRSLAEYVLTEERAYGLGELSITFVGQDEMTSLNAQYRGMEEPTDVLSFSLMDKGGEEFVSPVPLMGNVIICPEVAAANAEKDGRDLLNEISQLAVHGILHILDYGHATAEDETRMFERQLELVDGFTNAGQL